MFEAGEILLGKNALGRAIEFGYISTVGEARRRLAQAGATPEMGQTLADLMRPTLTEGYARGGALRKIVSLFDPRLLFEAAKYDAKGGSYEGTFLDLSALAQDLGRPAAGDVFQAIGLAQSLVGLPEDAPVEIVTSDITALLKTGERTFHRVTLEGLTDLPSLLEDLANRGGGRGFRGEPLTRAQILELLAPRLGPGANISTFTRALDIRDIPSKGPLAKAELWEIELLLDTGDIVTAAQKIDAAERGGGKTPATAYLRARHDLLARIEAPTILAQRVAALALSMSSFVELGLVAGEAWLAAADGRRAQAYAKDVLETKGIDEALRERAARVVREALVLRNASNTALRAPSHPPAKAPSLPPGGPPHEDRAQPFFGDPRAEPDLGLDRRSVPERSARESVTPGQRTTKKPSLPPKSMTPTGISIPRASTIPRVELPSLDVDDTDPVGEADAASAPTQAKSKAPPRGLTPPPASTVRYETNVGLGAGTAVGPAPTARQAQEAIDRSEELTPAEGFRPVNVPFPSPFPAPVSSTEPEKGPDSGHPALRESPTPTFSGEFMRGATRPPSLDGAPPPGFTKAPLFPPSDPAARSELAEHLSLPAGLSFGALSEALPRSVLEARVQFTHLARELGQKYRATKNVELLADLSGIEHMQAYLFERFAQKRVESPEAARDVQLHGAFLSEILCRRLAAEWIDISADQLGHWEMMVAPGTRVWPFGRVARLIAKGHKERDLVAYFLELQGKRDRAK